MVEDRSWSNQPQQDVKKIMRHDVELTLSHQRIALHSPYTSKLKILDDACHVLSWTTCTLLFKTGAVKMYSWNVSLTIIDFICFHFEQMDNVQDSVRFWWSIYQWKALWKILLKSYLESIFKNRLLFSRAPKKHGFFNKGQTDRELKHILTAPVLFGVIIIRFDGSGD